MKSSTQNATSFILNVTYFSIVFLVAFAIATLALVRRLNSYQATNTPFVLQVKKEELELANSVPAKVSKIHIKPGQHVKRGDMLVELSDQVAESKLTTLESVADDNISARTEAQVLKSMSDQYQIKAPRDGIIYKIEVAEETHVKSNTLLLTMFADDNVKLLGTLSPEQYLDLVKQKRLDVYSPRREQIFGVKLEGVSRVTAATTYEPSKYELYFQFVNSEDAAGFIQGENLDVVAKTRDDAQFRPRTIIMNFWQSLILGNAPAPKAAE